MEIKGYGSSQGVIFSSSNPTVLKQGDIYEALVKEKISDTEAIVQLRGMEVHVRVDQRLPNEGKIMLEIDHVQDGVVEGRIVAKPPSASSPKPETPELRQAAAILAEKSIPLTEEALEALRTFFHKGTGTVEQKLETIQAAANKRIAIRLPELTAIHEALHGKPLGAALEDIAKQLHLPIASQERLADLRVEFQAEADMERVKPYAAETKNPTIDRVAREAVVFQERGQEVERTSGQAEKEAVGERSNGIELVSSVRRQVENAVNVRSVEEAIRMAVQELPLELRERVLRTLNQAQRLESIERSAEGRHQLVQVLTEIENELSIGAAKVTRGMHPEAVESPSLSQIREIHRQVESAPSVRYVQEAIRTAARELPAELGEKVVQALDQALRLETLGLAQSARLRLMQALSSLEKDLAQLMHHFQLSLQTGSTDTRTVSATSAAPMAASEAFSDRVPTESPMVNNTEEISLLRDWIRRALKAIQREPDVTKALEIVKTEVVPKLREDHQKQNMMRAISEAEQLSEKGREMKARQTVVMELEKIETALPKDVPAMDIDGMMPIQLNTKDIMVQTVTKRMAEAALEFQRAKRDMMRNLNTVDHLIEQYRQSARPQAKQLVESVIKMLDQAILKSDMMLFADMVTEKRLLQASSQLAEAKKFLDKGDYEQARKVVQEVKNMLAQLQFKPSDVKIKHFVSQESMKSNDPAHAFWNKWSETIHPEPSARHVLETIRRLGLTYESDVANALVFKDEKQGEAEQTAKEWLLKLAQTEGNPAAKQAEQAAMSITGQQLLNKWDGANAMQTLFFTIPILLQNQVKDVKIYVNARNSGTRIDWENCSLYFLLENPWC